MDFQVGSCRPSFYGETLKLSGNRKWFEDESVEDSGASRTDRAEYT